MSPESPRQSAWKANSPGQYSYSRLGAGPELIQTQTSSPQHRHFWHRLKQGFSDSPKPHSSLPTSPKRQPKEGFTREREAAPSPASSPLRLSPEAVHVDNQEASVKASAKLLRTYMKSRSKTQSLCGFLEAAGPVESNDVNEIYAWSWLLLVTASVLRVKKPYRLQLRYLLRVADHVADPGWPVPPTVLLVLCDKLGFFADTSPYVLLRSKERVLLRSLAEKLSSIARTVLEWYFLHQASRVRAALVVGAVRVSFEHEGTELLPAQEIEASLTLAAQRRYTELKGHAEKVTKQIFLAFLTRNVTTELDEQFQRYPSEHFPAVHPVRIAAATFCANLLRELHSLQAASALEMNRDFFTLFESFLELDALANRGPNAPDAQNPEIRISNLHGQPMTPFLAKVCQVLEPYVISWISSLSDQLLRWDQSLVVSLSKQTPLPGSKGKTSRSLRDLFDGIVRIVGSENARLVYRSAPRYAALLDKALCRVILNRTQAITSLCHKALSQAAKQYYLPLPPALKKWRLPATGPVLSPNVCVLLNDMREVRSRFSTLVADITAPARNHPSGPSSPLRIANGSEEPPGSRAPPKPPKDAPAGRAKPGFFSRLWSGRSAGASDGPAERTDGTESGVSEIDRNTTGKKARPSKDPGKQKDERRTSESGGKAERERALVPAAPPRKPERIPSATLLKLEEESLSSIALPKPWKKAAGGEAGGSKPGKNDGSTSLLFREAVARSLSAPERPLQKLHKPAAEEPILRAASVFPDTGSGALERVGVGKAGKKKESMSGRSAGKGAEGARAVENGTEPAEQERIWAEEDASAASTSEERFSVLRMEVEKQYYELVRSVARMITQDFAPFLEGVILGPEPPAPSAHPVPGVRRRSARTDATDFGLALDARRRMKPLLDYIMETFQDERDLMDRSVLRRLARDTWDSSAEALLSLLPSFQTGATNIGGCLQGLAGVDDDSPYSDDGASIDLSSIDEAAPRLKRVGAVSAQMDELFADLIVSVSTSTSDSRKKVSLAPGRGAGVALPANEVPRNVRKLREVLDAFSGVGSAASWSSTSYAR
ncbi:hypothetical protein KFL_000200210 [Klebsormidium nitens]|uniref:Uncharacterized protein n=1 Tax=Klebsormidium nitens TaxID=105231 RepID=A0A1Y1HNV5_KLENI|nr:hypothetical protein KFL_000200210 [Klebsormidium nitens]|eukprot:GAQ78869.1 hypothetical protein KFL_000200210 [Klebsormidium nitens]